MIEALSGDVGDSLIYPIAQYCSPRSIRKIALSRVLQKFILVFWI
jgi:hypothetical protein